MQVRGVLRHEEQRSFPWFANGSTEGSTAPAQSLHTSGLDREPLQRETGRTAMTGVRHRKFRAWQAASLTFAVMGVAACRSSSDAVGDAAQKACSQARLTRVVSATATTVGEIRGQREGPGQQPYKEYFNGVADSHTAAWCWTQEGPHKWQAHAVAAGKAEPAGTVEGPDAPPKGPPRFP